MEPGSLLQYTAEEKEQESLNKAEEQKHFPYIDSEAVEDISQRGSADSILWRIQNPIGQSPEQFGLSSVLTWLWAGGGTPEVPSSLKHSMTFFPLKTTAPISSTSNTIQAFKYNGHLSNWIKRDDFEKLNLFLNDKKKKINTDIWGNLPSLHCSHRQCPSVPSTVSFPEDGCSICSFTFIY